VPRYRAYGLTIDSQIALPPLSLAAADAAPDVRIRTSALPPFEQELGLKGRAWANLDHVVTVRMLGVGTFRLTQGSCIEVHPDEQVASGDLSAFLLGPVLCSLLLQRGFFPINGCAVDTPQGAILFLGRAGVGKSTLTAALASRGFPLICDEVAALRIHEGEVQVMPGYPTHQLWGESLQHFRIDPDTLLPVRPGIRKFHVPAKQFQDQPRLVRAVFLPLAGNQNEFEVRPCDPKNALALTAVLAYRRILVHQLGQVEQQIGLAKRMADNVPFYNVLRTRDLQQLAPLCEAVVSLFPTEPGKFAGPLPAPVEQPHSDERRPESERKHGFFWLASYPKSGNTWVRALLTAWKKVQDGAPNLAALEGQSRMNDRFFFDEEVGIDSELLTLDELHVYRSRLHADRAAYLPYNMITKIHDVCELNREGALLFPPESTAGVVYVMRNPLDTAVSCSHHYQIPIARVGDRLALKDSWIHAPLGGIREALPQRVGNWSEHVLSWVVHSGLRCVLVRYEDLIEDTLREFKRILLFLGETYHEERAKAAVRSASFESLQREEQQKGFNERPHNASNFFRNGKIGDWRESLPPEVAAQISRDHAPAMRRFGYGAEADEAVARAFRSLS
jgi:aryl sulfotransferase